MVVLDIEAVVVLVGYYEDRRSGFESRGIDFEGMRVDFWYTVSGVRRLLRFEWPCLCGALLDRDVWLR